MKKFNLGLCSVSFRKHTPEDIIKECQRLSLDSIEWGSDLHAPCDNIESLHNIASLQNKYGIKCSSYGTYFHLGKDSLQNLEDYIKAAKILGTDILRLWCGEKNSIEYSDTEREELISECIKAAQMAKKYGVVLCMECHPGSLTDTAKSAVELMERVNSPHFKMYWQTNTEGDEDLGLTEAKLLAPHTVNIHVFYWVDNVQQSLANGIKPWRKYLNEFDGEKSLLIEFVPGGKIETLESEVNALKTIVENI